MATSDKYKVFDASKERLDAYLQAFYGYFENGYVFEEFLKIYLERIGLDEVTVTQKSSDGGIDLKAVRYGVGELYGADSVDYYIQAKRYKPDSTISPEKIRALRGVMESGTKGIFITTARFSKKETEFAVQDPSRPITLIDGKKLVTSCIENQLGFIYTPEFSKESMDVLMKHASKESEVSTSSDKPSLVIDKQITANDIRARILRMPRDVAKRLEGRNTVLVTFNGQEPRELRIDKSRAYFGGVTDCYREAGVILTDGSCSPCRAEWKCYEDRIEITLKNE